MISENLGVYEPIALDAHDYTGIQNSLEQDGVCVIKNILSQEDQSSFLSQFWSAVEKRNPKLSRTDPTTWTAENTDWFGTRGAGQYKHYGRLFPLYNAVA